jgi:hypothetical protein
MLKIIALLLFSLAAGPLHAYIGPGAGISVLGSLLGILATILVAMGAIIFWPLRKLLKRRKAAAQADHKAAEPPAVDTSEQ